MKTKKASFDSENAKKDIIDAVKKKAIIPEIKNLDNIVIVRGKMSMLIDGDISNYVLDQEMAAHFAEIITASEENEYSYHQIDYIMFSKMVPFSKREIKTKDIPVEFRKEHGTIKNYFKELAKEEKKKSDNMNILFVILSREGIELQCFDVVESKDKNENVLGRVVSDLPVITKIGEDKKKSLIVIEGMPLLNIFEKDLRKELKVIKTGLDKAYFDMSFSKDKFFFKEKSEFLLENTTEEAQEPEEDILETK